MIDDYRKIKGHLYSLEGIVVYLYKDEHNSIIVKAMNGETKSLDTSTYRELLQRIPLTKNILVKNFKALPSAEPKGLPSNSFNKYKIEISNQINKTLYFEVQGGTIYWFEPNAKSYYGYRLTLIRFVDELQSILV